MKKTLSLALLLTLPLGLAFAATTGAISTTNSSLNVTATTTPLVKNIVKQGFDFYEITTDGTAGTVVLNSATSTRTAPTAWTLTKNGTTSTDGQPAVLQLSGTSGQTVNVTFDTSTNLAGATNTTSILTLTGVECGTALSSSGVATLGTDGSLQLTCGATLNIPVSAPVDLYSGKVNVNVVYQ